MERYITDYEKLLELLQDDGVTHRVDKSDKSVQIPTQSGELDSVLLIRWQDEDGVIQFIQTLPLEIPVERVSEIERAITLLNHALAIPGFGFNHQYRTLYFRMILPIYPRGKVLDEEIKSIFRASVKNASDFLAVLRKVSEGYVSGNNVIEEFKKSLAQHGPEGNPN